MEQLLQNDRVGHSNFTGSVATQQFITNAKVKEKEREIEIGPHLAKLSLKQDRQALLKAKYCPRVAAVSIMHTKHTKPM